MSKLRITKVVIYIPIVTLYKNDLERCVGTAHYDYQDQTTMQQLAGQPNLLKQPSMGYLGAAIASNKLPQKLAIVNI